MLNHAAALRTFFSSVVFVAVAMLATQASALEGIDLSGPQEPAGEGECPRLIQIKYPFLSCVNGQVGQSDVDETWENSRQLPQQGSWNEGDGAFGPDQNQD